MNVHTAQGCLQALSALGLNKTASTTEAVIKELIRTNPGLVLGLTIGAGIGLYSLASRDKRREVYPYRLEPNPLYSSR